MPRVKKPKLHKEYCEIEGCPIKDPKLLQHHHIIERKEIVTSNDQWNLSVICANHHLLIHSGILRIIGVYPSTTPQGRILVYELNGIKNIDIDESYFKYKPPQSKLFRKS